MDRLKLVMEQRIRSSTAPSEGAPDEETDQCAEQEHDQQETDNRIAHCAQKVRLYELCRVNTVRECIDHHGRACCHAYVALARNSGLWVIRGARPVPGEPLA